MLAVLYMQGRGVSQDLVQAYAWHIASAQGTGSGNLQMHLSLLQKMTPGEIDEGEALSRVYIEKYVRPFRKAE